MAENEADDDDLAEILDEIKVSFEGLIRKWPIEKRPLGFEIKLIPSPSDAFAFNQNDIDILGNTEVRDQENISIEYFVNADVQYDVIFSEPIELKPSEGEKVVKIRSIIEEATKFFKREATALQRLNAKSEELINRHPDVMRRADEAIARADIVLKKS